MRENHFSIASSTTKKNAVELAKNSAKLKELPTLIISLTKKNKYRRLETIQEVVRAFKRLSSDIVKTSDEFISRLNSACPGDKIVFGRGVYEGPLKLNANSVDIVGQGVATVIKGWKNGVCLTVSGNECSVSNVKITSTKQKYVGVDLKGSRNTLQNITLAVVQTCIKVFGNNNKLQGLTLTNAEVGIQIDGSHNSLDQLKLQNMSVHGIKIGRNVFCSEANTIRNVTSVNVKVGICSFSGSNNFFNISLVKGSQNLKYFGIQLHSPNNIVGLNCSGYSRSKKDWGLVFQAPLSSVSDSQPGSVRVGCGASATLTGVDCGELIQIDNLAGAVRLIDCRGRGIKDPGNRVSGLNCNFTMEVIYL